MAAPPSFRDWLLNINQMATGGAVTAPGDYGRYQDYLKSIGAPAAPPYQSPFKEVPFDPNWKPDYTGRAPSAGYQGSPQYSGLESRDTGQAAAPTPTDLVPSQYPSLAPQNQNTLQSFQQQPQTIDQLIQLLTGTNPFGNFQGLFNYGGLPDPFQNYKI